MGKMQFFEPTEDQKRLADLGRKMMDYSEYADMTGLKDEEIAVFNHLSHAFHGGIVCLNSTSENVPRVIWVIDTQVINWTSRTVLCNIFLTPFLVLKLMCNIFNPVNPGKEFLWL